MTIRTPTYLKSVFESNDIPQQADYGDVFDSFLPLTATGKQTLDISLEIGGDFTASGDIYGRGFFGNTVSVSALDLVKVSASVVNSDRVNANIVSASGGEFNVINAQHVSASTSNIKYPRRSVNSSVAATGTTTASATSVTEAMSWVKVATSAANEALIVGRSRPGYVQYVINDASASARIFPTSGSKFNQLANGVAYDIPDRTTLAIYHITSAQYFTSRTSR